MNTNLLRVTSLLTFLLGVGYNAWAQEQEESSDIQAQEDKPVVMESVPLRIPDRTAKEPVATLTVEDLALADPIDCLNLRQVDEIEILNEKYVIFHTRRKSYVNVLSHCATLRPRHKLLLKPRASRICSKDFVTVLGDGGGSIQSIGLGQSINIPGVTELGQCSLGKFSEMPEANLEVLRAQVDIERQLKKTEHEQEKALRKERKRQKKEQKAREKAEKKAKKENE